MATVNLSLSPGPNASAIDEADVDRIESAHHVGEHVDEIGLLRSDDAPYALQRDGRVDQSIGIDHTSPVGAALDNSNGPACLQYHAIGIVDEVQRRSIRMTAVQHLGILSTVWVATDVTSVTPQQLVIIAAKNQIEPFGWVAASPQRASDNPMSWARRICVTGMAKSQAATQRRWRVHAGAL
ncbi:hypothetical protein CSUB01_12639 [Colletotrichum sublineola]|uniref:Uncharacterized protein n=1 Tax=Colletotrichum sublineola TaxID=1173701 RepID=A0A066XSV9_COLSU|nr:hypothetical protein CSUB01_12639 [Colletotrichum sublineola]